MSTGGGLVSKKHMGCALKRLYLVGQTDPIQVREVYLGETRKGLLKMSTGMGSTVKGV